MTSPDRLESRTERPGLGRRFAQTAGKLMNMLSGVGPDAEAAGIAPRGPVETQRSAADDASYATQRRFAISKDGGAQGVLWNPDATTGTIPRVGADGHPVEKAS